MMLSVISGAIGAAGTCRHRRVMILKMYLIHKNTNTTLRIIFIFNFSSFLRRVDTRSKMRLRRKSRQKLLMVALVLLVILYWWQGSASDEDDKETKSEVKVILTYPSSNDQPMSMERCRVNRCIIANDMALYNDSHAFVVDSEYFTKRDDLPDHRPTHQNWFLRQFNAPDGNINLLKLYNGLFNGLISYSTNSHVYVPFGQIRTLIQDKESLQNYAEGKTSLVAWMPESCESDSKRERYVFQLADHLQVDTFGVCGKKVCGDGGNQTELCNPKEILGRTHMFYLSFEKKFCYEYITGELWDALRNNMVPVIMAQDDIYEILPEGSFIDIRDFDSPRLLAEHIVKVGKNASAYNAYHEWRESFYITDMEPWQCALCEMLHTETLDLPVVDNMGEFWSADDCSTSDEFFSEIKNFTVSY